MQLYCIASKSFPIYNGKNLKSADCLNQPITLCFTSVFILLFCFPSLISLLHVFIKCYCNPVHTLYFFGSLIYKCLFLVNNLTIKPKSYTIANEKSSELFRHIDCNRYDHSPDVLIESEIQSTLFYSVMQLSIISNQPTKK